MEHLDTAQGLILLFNWQNQVILTSDGTLLRECWMNTDVRSHKDRWIVVVGRDNIAKSSRSLEQMIKDLSALGFSVQNLEQRHVVTSRLMNSWFEGLLARRVAVFCRQRESLGRWIRRAIKALWLVFHPSSWDLSRFSEKKTYNEERALDLRSLLRHWRAQHSSRQVYLFAHSAGGIVSSWLENEANVVSLVCFGYPFKHLENSEEPFRTMHLKHMRKPFLIIQGDRDSYGTKEKARQYELSASIRIVPINANHSYDALTPETYRGCLELVAQHFSE
jgi:hypothetical protein